MAVKSGKQWRRMPQNEDVNEPTPRKSGHSKMTRNKIEKNRFLSQIEISLKYQDTQL